MADVTWAPEMVEKVAREICEAQEGDGWWDTIPDTQAEMSAWNRERGSECTICRDDFRSNARAALSASPLPDALDLIQRMLDGRQGARADARAFLARVRG